MLQAPLTALPLVGLVGAARAAVVAGAPALVVAGVVVAAGALYSRAMHLDGLADTADGLSAGYDAPSSLRAMKASDTGPSGVAAVVLALLLQVCALSVLLGSTAGTVLAGLAWLASRQSLAWSCRRGVPAAQPEGLGALVAGTVGRAALAASTGLLVTVALAAGSAPPTALPGGPGPAWWHALGVLAAAVVSGALLRRRCVRRLGGITGDVLGAGIELSLTAALVIAALLPAPSA
jgi:adenosylcobinamide-GDP ribazoletransferase